MKLVRAAPLAHKVLRVPKVSKVQMVKSARLVPLDLRELLVPLVLRVQLELVVRRVSKEMLDLLVQPDKEDPKDLWGIQATPV